MRGVNERWVARRKGTVRGVDERWVARRKGTVRGVNERWVARRKGTVRGKVRKIRPRSEWCEKVKLSAHIM